MFSKVKEAQPLYAIVLLGHFYLACNACETTLKRLMVSDDNQKIDSDMKNFDWSNIAPPLIAFLIVCQMLTVQA